MLHPAFGLHGHEYSPKRERPSLKRTAFSTSASLSTIRDISTDSSTSQALDSSRSSPPTNTAILRIPEHVSFILPETGDADDATMSEDEQSYAPSEASEKPSKGSRKKRRSAAISKSYAIAHPAPLTTRQKLLHIRPKLLLQLQCIASGKRATPTLDVLASTRVVPRLANNFPRLFKGRQALGPSDVMVFKSEDYDATENNPKDYEGEEDLGHRQAVAVICHVRSASAQAEICFDDGTIWHASEIPKGFEFVTEDSITGEKMTARWVTAASSKRLSHSSLASDVSSGVQYTFSVIHPERRRHPILATLSQDQLDVRDSYRSLSSSSLVSPPTSIGEDAASPTVRREYVLVDEKLKTIIRVMSIWVILRSGWCPNFKYADNIQEPCVARPGVGSRASSFNSNSLVESRSPDPIPNSSPRSTFGSKRGRNRPKSIGIYDHLPVEAAAQQALDHSSHRRAMSTGTAFLQNRASVRRHKANSNDHLNPSLDSNSPTIVHEPVLEDLLSPAIAIETYRAPLVIPERVTNRQVVYDTASGGKVSEDNKRNPRNTTVSRDDTHSKDKKGWKRAFGLFRKCSKRR